MKEQTLKNIYDTLVKTAERNSLIYYFLLNRDLPKKNSSNFLNPFQPLFNHLNKLNDILVKNEMPLLTSLVVNKKSGTPGRGFFYYAEKLGRFTGDLTSSFDRDKFWQTEKIKVYNYDWHDVCIFDKPEENN